jgi:hypothetical protein
MTMDDASQREIAALADGSLRAADRPEALARADADALALQREALAAIRATDGERAPAALRMQVTAMAAQAAPRRRRAWRARPPGFADVTRPLGGAGVLARSRIAFAGAAAAALAAVVLVGAAGAPSGPSVAQAARLTLAPAATAAPVPRPDGTLSVSVDGLAYPYWGDTARWQAVGARTDSLHGRTVRTVYYMHDGRRIGYAIAAGAPLSVHGGTVVERNGVRTRILRSGDLTIVTWLRDGHTCILAGRGVDAGALVRLASGP